MDSNYMLSSTPLLVSTKNRNIIFPNKCIFCCNASEVTNKRDIETTVYAPGYKAQGIKLSFEIPYCRRHMDLSQRLENSKYTFVAVMILSLLSVFIPTLLHKYIISGFSFKFMSAKLELSGVDGVLLALGIICGVSLAVWFNINQNRRLKKQYPELLKVPLSKLKQDVLEISIRGKSEIVNNTQVALVKELELRFHNHDYAKLFVNKNTDAVVVK